MVENGVNNYNYQYPQVNNTPGIVHDNRINAANYNYYPKLNTTSVPGYYTNKNQQNTATNNNYQKPQVNNTPGVAYNNNRFSAANYNYQNPQYSQYPQQTCNTADQFPQDAKVNVNINTTPSMPYYGYPPCQFIPYPYPMPYPFPFNCNNQPQQNNNPLASQGLDKTSSKTNEAPKTKHLTPLTKELKDKLFSDLTTTTDDWKKDNEKRQLAVTQLSNLINEDRETRKNDKDLNDLLKTASHPNQPKAVKEFADMILTNLEYNIPGSKAPEEKSNQEEPAKTEEQPMVNRADILYPQTKKEDMPTGSKLNVVSK